MVLQSLQQSGKVDVISISQLGELKLSEAGLLPREFVTGMKFELGTWGSATSLHQLIFIVFSHGKSTACELLRSQKNTMDWILGISRYTILRHLLTEGSTSTGVTDLWDPIRYIVQNAVLILWQC